MPKTKPATPPTPKDQPTQHVTKKNEGEGASSMGLSTAPASPSLAPTQSVEMPDKSTETAVYGGALADRARGLQRGLLARGYVVDMVVAIEVVAASEAASWRADWPRHATYGELLWPCGHIQAQTIEGRREDWHPMPHYWRPLYVPPRLVTGSRSKGLAGSVVSATPRAMSV